MNTLREVLRNINKVDRIDFLGPCWEWQLYRDKDAYGRVNFRQRMFYAHRLVFSLLCENPGDLCVCHLCDNPPCLNPSHMFLGTRTDNNHDAIRKGRMTAVNAARATLTESDVIEIKRHAYLGMSQSTIGNRYGVSQSLVSLIVNGHCWSHVKEHAP